MKQIQPLTSSSSAVSTITEIIKWKTQMSTTFWEWWPKSPQLQQLFKGFPWTDYTRWGKKKAWFICDTKIVNDNFSLLKSAMLYYNQY